MVYDIISYFFMYVVLYFNILFLFDNKKIEKRIFLVGIILSTFIYFISTPFRILVQIIMLIFLGYVLSKDIKKAISVVLFQYFILVLLDVIVAMIFRIGKLETDYFLKFLINIVFSFVFYMIVRSKVILQFWKAVQKRLDKYIYLLLLLLFGCGYLYLGVKYNIYNILVIGGIVLLFVYFFIGKIVEMYRLELEIEKMNEYLEICEKHLEIQRINQHEYRNILLLVKSMDSDNKKIKEFIDSILEEEEDTIDYNILREVQKLEISPLRGLIYYKLLVCKEKNISVIVNISPVINYKKVNKIDGLIIKDLSMIFGILLDNAIEACLESKDKCLSIYVYEEDNGVVLQISNTFKGTINLDLLYKKGYSTKGKNHGYGLFLVQRKIRNNDSLSIKSEVHNDVFIQYLKLKL